MANTAQPSLRGVHLNYTGEWSTGTFECCSDFKTLLCACCCTPCFLCDLDRDAGVIIIFCLIFERLLIFFIGIIFN